jgi:hypothetical protein
MPQAEEGLRGPEYSISTKTLSPVFQLSFNMSKIEGFERWALDLVAALSKSAAESLNE